MQKVQWLGDDPFGGQGDFDIVAGVNEAQRLHARRIDDLQAEVNRLQQREQQWQAEYLELLGLFQVVQEGLVVKPKPKPTLKSVQVQIANVLAVIGDGLRSQPLIAA